MNKRRAGYRSAQTEHAQTARSLEDPETTRTTIRRNVKIDDVIPIVSLIRLYALAWPELGGEVTARNISWCGPQWFVQSTKNTPENQGFVEMGSAAPRLVKRKKHNVVSRIRSLRIAQIHC